MVMDSDPFDIEHIQVTVTLLLENFIKLFTLNKESIVLLV